MLSSSPYQVEAWEQRRQSVDVLVAGRSQKPGTLGDPGSITPSVNHLID